MKKNYKKKKKKFKGNNVVPLPLKSKPENGKIWISLSRSVSLSLSNPPSYMHYALKQTTTKHGALSLKPEEEVSVLLRCFYHVSFFSIRI